MDLWASSSATATAAASATAAAAVVANELGAPTGGGQHDSGSFFDPWFNVNCDELDLSIILSQHPHHHVPTHLTAFCDSNNNNNTASNNNHNINSNPSSSLPHQRAPSMINNSNDFSSNNNSTQSTSSPADMASRSYVGGNSRQQGLSQINHYQSSIKNNGSLIATLSATTCSSSPDPSSSSILIEPSNHGTCSNSNQVQSSPTTTVGNKSPCTGMQINSSCLNDPQPQQHMRQDLVIANCSSNFDAAEKKRFSPATITNSDCKSSSSFANRQTTSHNNNFFDHILNHNSTSMPTSQSAISKSIPTNYSSRALANSKMHNQQLQQQNQQLSCLSCTSATSPITSSSVSSSIELSPQNSVDIPSNSTSSHTCYPLGTSYRLNVLTPISPSSLIIGQTIEPDQHRSTSLPLLRNINGLDQCDSRRLSDGHTKIDPSHLNEGQQYIDSYGDDQVGTLLRKSSVIDEVAPLFDANRCHGNRSDNIMNNSDGCRCSANRNNDDGGSCGHESRQRIRNNLENLLYLASGADSSSIPDGSRDCNQDCKRMTGPNNRQIDAHQQMSMTQTSQQTQSPGTSAHLAHSEGRYGDHSNKNISQNERLSHLANDNSTSQVDNERNKIGGKKGSRLRRCRHITDYVLAEEEKRLLIKEGYTDFPMTSSSTRPLSRAEERILRKIRRKIRNKKSAQCSRQRKKEYVEELERKYTMVVRENEELKQLLKRIQHANQA